MKAWSRVTVTARDTATEKRVVIEKESANEPAKAVVIDREPGAAVLVDRRADQAEEADDRTDGCGDLKTLSEVHSLMTVPSTKSCKKKKKEQPKPAAQNEKTPPPLHQISN